MDEIIMCAVCGAEMEMNVDYRQRECPHCGNTLTLEPLHEYDVVWELLRKKLTHHRQMSFTEIKSLFSFNYRMGIPANLLKALWAMKKGQSVSYTIPGIEDRITITVAKDIEPLPF